MSLTLNLFTNATYEIAKRKTIKETYDSFCNTFGQPDKINIFYNKAPNKNKSHIIKYENYLRQSFDAKLYITSGLADGWMKSLELSETEFIFHLEHDFIFVKEKIHQDLKTLQNIMLRNDLFYLLFPRSLDTEYDVYKDWDVYLKTGERPTPYFPIAEVTYEGVKFRKLTGLSNNPQLLHKERYKNKALPYLTKNHNRIVYERDYGVEQNLKDYNGEGAILYGGQGENDIVYHINGRGQREKVKIRRISENLRESER